VAIETTAGVVIKPGMNNASAYFKGIEFDNPGEIKRFDSLRKKANDVCRDASELIKDWNENVAEKQLRPDEIIAKKSRIEQRNRIAKALKTIWKNSNHGQFITREIRYSP